jgi:ribosomal-protein-alanine N-acetyltransferase
VFSANLYDCRHADITDIDDIQNALQLFYTHQHLDWESLRDQIQSNSVALCFQNDQLTGILSISGNDIHNQWIKLFSVSDETKKHLVWRKLAAYQLSKRGKHAFYTVAFWDWYRDLVFNTSSFSLFDEIVTLEITGIQPRMLLKDSGQISVIHKEDIKEIFEIDQAAFRSPWKLDSHILQSAVDQSAIAIMIKEDQKPCGYLIADFDDFSAHLSRIAVDPGSTAKGYGTQLLNHLFSELLRKRIFKVTVNTQVGNNPSLALYRKFGFELTGDKLPVLKFAVDNNH